MKRLIIEASCGPAEAAAVDVAVARGWAPLELTGVELARADAWASVTEACLFVGGAWRPPMARRLRMLWPENQPAPIVPVYVTDDARCMDWRVLERAEAARILGWPTSWAGGVPRAVEEAATLAAAAKMAAPRGSFRPSRWSGTSCAPR